MTTQERIEELKAELTKLEKQHEMEQLAQQLATHGADIQAYASGSGYDDDCHNRAKLLLAAAGKPIQFCTEWNVTGEMIEIADGPALRDMGISLLIPEWYSKQNVIDALRSMLKFAEQPEPPKPAAEAPGDGIPF